MVEELRKFFEEKVLGHFVRVELNDSRKIYGKLYCVDKKKNLVLVEAIEEINDLYVAPINKQIHFLQKNENFLIKFKKNATAEEDEKFCRNKFYIGQAIIPGLNIQKMELLEEE